MIAGCLIFAASYYGIDKKLIVFTAFIIGVFTEIFAGIGILVAAIPVVGPMIIKIVSIPIFWILNALGTLVSGIAIKKGYATEAAQFCVHYAFQKNWSKSLVSIISPSNSPSIAVAKGIGMNFDRAIVFQKVEAQLYRIENKD